MAAKWIPKKPKSAPPLTFDQLVQLKDEIKQNEPPKELQSLKSSHSFTIPGTASDLKLESALNKLDLGGELTTWNNKGEQNIIRGIPGKEAGRLSLDEVMKTKGTDEPVKGHCPN